MTEDKRKPGRPALPPGEAIKESTMATTYSTAAEAIERSISHDEIARCKRTAANLATLRELCEGSVEADEHEFWGEDDNGNEWRVHMPAAA